MQAAIPDLLAVVRAAQAVVDADADFGVAGRAYNEAWEQLSAALAAFEDGAA